MERLKITVLKWDEYQPRKDVKKSSWFRMEHAIMLSTKHLGLTGGDILGLLYILSLCSEENSKTVQIVPEHVAIFSRIGEGAFLGVVEKLVSVGLVRAENTSTLREKHAHVSLRTNERDERTNEEKTYSGLVDAPPDPAQPVLPGVPVPTKAADSAQQEVLAELAVIGDSLKGRVKLAVQERWLGLYSPEFIIRKIQQLDVWCIENPHKAPKSRFSSWYSGILAKDWEIHRKTLPSNKPGQPLRHPMAEA